MGALTRMRMRKLFGAGVLTLALMLVSADSAHAADMSGVVDTLLGKYQHGRPRVG
jgi:hypothetical protein